MFDDCTETVSILYALVFGADGACIMLSTGSILSAFAAFMVLVIIAQFIARKLWAKLTDPGTPMADDQIAPTGDHPYRDDPKYRDSAIRSSKR